MGLRLVNGHRPAAGRVQFPPIPRTRTCRRSWRAHRRPGGNACESGRPANAFVEKVGASSSILSWADQIDPRRGECQIGIPAIRARQLQLATRYISDILSVSVVRSLLSSCRSLCLSWIIKAMPPLDRTRLDPRGHPGTMVIRPRRRGESNGRLARAVQALGRGL